MHVPAAIEQIRGKPVETFGMRGPFALQAEILRGSHQPFAKQ